MLKRVCMVALAVAILVWPTQAATDDLKARARDLRDKAREALVSVKLVMSQRYVVNGREMNKQENKSEVAGTIIDPSGLTVVSNFMTNPMAQMAEGSDGGGERMGMKIETEINDVKMVLSDGTEIAAQMVLKDKDLDLAFVRPREKQARPLPHVSFARPSTEPILLDDIVTVGRLGRAVNRECSVSLGHIQAIVKRPRTFYVGDLMNGFFALGCPVFTGRGETLGIQVMRLNPVKGSDLGGLFGGFQPVILPSEDLLDVARQAADAKM